MRFNWFYLIWINKTRWNFHWQASELSSCDTKLNCYCGYDCHKYGNKKYYTRPSDGRIEDVQFKPIFPQLLDSFIVLMPTLWKPLTDSQTYIPITLLTRPRISLNRCLREPYELIDDDCQKKTRQNDGNMIDKIKKKFSAKKVFVVPRSKTSPTH